MLWFRCYGSGNIFVTMKKNNFFVSKLSRFFDTNRKNYWSNESWASCLWLFNKGWLVIIISFKSLNKKPSRNSNYELNEIHIDAAINKKKKEFLIR